MLVKLSSTLAQLLVFHTATPSLMCEPRDESSSVLEERETAGASGFELFIVIFCLSDCRTLVIFVVLFYLSCP